MDGESQMWSNINNKPDKWEKLTGKPYGFEPHEAKVRRAAREFTDTRDDVLPSTRRKVLTRREKREADKVLRAGKVKKRKS